ncbi:MAG: pirin family protein, partial [Pseudomonadota bacterium]
MQYVRRANERGAANFGWLQSKHSFSFGNYYDNKHMGISALRVINDDTVAPGAGFGAHGHRDMEIISYVLEGALEHKDNQGNEHVVKPGEVQRMSAGTGVVHSEYNASNTDRVKFLQIWIQPNVFSTAPGYEQKQIEQDGKLTPLVTPTGSDGSISVQQDMQMMRVKLNASEDLDLMLEEGRVGYLHIIKGKVTIDGNVYSAGDAVSPEKGATLSIKADDEVEG